jgi:hypothetical protein
MDELTRTPVVLFHSPEDQFAGLFSMLAGARVDWRGKVLVFCDCFVPQDKWAQMKTKGASVAVARNFGMPGRILVEADRGKQAKSTAASRAVYRLCRELGDKPVSIPASASDLFDAAVTLASGAVTPLIDHAASLLRQAGLRDMEAVRVASSIFEQTARDYAHSGRQSWVWHVRSPDHERLREQLAAAGPELQGILRQLLLEGFERFRRHRETAVHLAPGVE